MDIKGIILRDLELRILAIENVVEVTLRTLPDSQKHSLRLDLQNRADCLSKLPLLKEAYAETELQKVADSVRKSLPDDDEPNP